MNEGEGFLARIIPATRMLQSLANVGSVSPNKIQKAEDKLKADKTAYKEYMDEIFQTHILEMKQYNHDLKNMKDPQKIINLLSASLANFRADTSMIDEQRYFAISSVALRWIESISEVDQDAQDIINGYILGTEKINKTEDILLEDISDIAAEMSAACDRYFEKRANINWTQNIENSKNLYISERNNNCGIEAAQNAEDEE